MSWVLGHLQDSVTASHTRLTYGVASGPGFGNQFIFGYEVEVELSIQLENVNEVEYE